MNIKAVITELMTAEGPSRDLDCMIAELIGWTRRIQYVNDNKGAPKRKTSWVVPDGDDIGRVPYYTANEQEAYELARRIAPNSVGGFTWDSGRGNAAIDDISHYDAATPALALCIAALQTKLKQESQR